MVSILIGMIYLAFISLGLPDSVLGAAWPSMYEGLGVPMSYAGIISMIIAVGTVVSSLQSDRMTKVLGTGKVMVISVAMTAVALLGFSMSDSFITLCLLAVPYGLGAGSIDAALNNYVALHYSSRHMSWLHCMWGVGTIIGPYIMGYALVNLASWHIGYRYIGILQLVLALILVFSLPLWKKRSNEGEEEEQATSKPLSLRNVLRIKGAKEVMITFFCYCALEQTAMLWSGSYLVLRGGISAKEVASLASLFFIGITAGRAINGFLTMRFSDSFLIRLGEGIIAIGILIIFMPISHQMMLMGFILIGLGCAPIYPCIIHMTPTLFGEDKSQVMIGVQMASAYIGICLIPPLFGWLASQISIALLPIYLLVFLIIMVMMYERLVKQTKRHV